MNMKSYYQRIVAVIVLVVVIALSFGAGIYVSSHSYLGRNSEPSKTADLTAFWTVWNLLDEKYVETHGSSTPITDEAKVYGAIKGLAEAYGDPYTTFFPPVEAKEFNAEISGKLEGIGAEVGLKDDVITIVAPLKNTPAYRAGLKPGDRILKIDDTVTSSFNVEQAVSLLRGKKGTSVELTILSQNATEPHVVRIVRDVISIPTLETERRKDGVFVIRLYNFSQDSASLFRNALQQFVNSGSNKLLLDVRGNPGGYLEASIDMASWFLPADKVIVKEGASDDQIESHMSIGYNIFNKNLKMVILIDGGSASASEILAGALKENGVAQLVGTKTFGKGSVQELIPITGDTALKVTVARWLTPNGRSISEQGIIPDVEVKVTPEDVAKGYDAQFEKGVELLLAK